MVKGTGQGCAGQKGKGRGAHCPICEGRGWLRRGLGDREALLWSANAGNCCVVFGDHPFPSNMVVRLTPQVLEELSAAMAAEQQVRDLKAHHHEEMRQATYETERAVCRRAILGYLVVLGCNEASVFWGVLVHKEPLLFDFVEEEGCMKHKARVYMRTHLHAARAQC